MTAHINVLRHLAERQRPSRLPYLRQYPPNTTWHGWLSPNAIATFNQRGGTFTRKESGALEFRLNKTSITLTVDEDNHIQDVAFAAHVRDRESYEIILRMIKALQDRPLIEEVLDNITETRDRLEMQQSLSGFAELRRMIRNDTGLAIMTISGMDEAEEDE